MQRGVGIIIVVAIFFSAILCFAQDSRKFYPFPQSDRNASEEAFRNIIRSTANVIKNDMFDMVYACQAVREDDFSYCDKSTDKRTAV